MNGGTQTQSTPNINTAHTLDIKHISGLYLGSLQFSVSSPNMENEIYYIRKNALSKNVLSFNKL